MIRLLLPLLLIGGPAIAGKPHATKSIPTAFQGDWALETRECAPGPSDSGNMHITAQRIVNFESTGQVIRVLAIDPLTIRVESRFIHSGGTYGSLNMMSLSTDKTRMTIGEMSDISVYKRCSK